MFFLYISRCSRAHKSSLQAGAAAAHRNLLRGDPFSSILTSELHQECMNDAAQVQMHLTPPGPPSTNTIQAPPLICSCGFIFQPVINLFTIHDEHCPAFCSSHVTNGRAAHGQ